MKKGTLHSPRSYLFEKRFFISCIRSNICTSVELKMPTRQFKISSIFWSSSFKKILALDSSILLLFCLSTWAIDSKLNDKEKKLKILCILCACFFHFVVVILFSVLFLFAQIRAKTWGDGQWNGVIQNIRFVESNWIHAKQTATTTDTANSKGTNLKKRIEKENGT